ncbi:hypothetical protein EMIHUDRAFT_49130, partial [Emiliania huxleyi CCMP1516]|uniref:CBM1 domain-containing protein n=2 Tax=Emiliania huxleyi TaxID=2903 RepID=A0A0D3IXP8_EMIH1
FTTGSLPTLLLRDSAGQLGAWDQCGGMAYTGSTKCPKDYVCSARQPGFSQCVPGWIPLWYSAWRTGDCGGAKYAGPTKCPNDYACKYRSVTLSQCIP